MTIIAMKKPTKEEADTYENQVKKFFSHSPRRKTCYMEIAGIVISIRKTNIREDIKSLRNMHLKK